MKIFLLLAHPNKDSFNGAIADTYEKTALEKGHEVRRLNLGEMQFDPILWGGYKGEQKLEPDLLKAREHIGWCEHWVIVYPVWWGSLPGLFKGFLDRALLPGYAFKYHKDGPMWDKLLKGRSAHILRTSDGPWWWLWAVYRNSDVNTLKQATLKFCGINPVKVTSIGQLRNSKSEYRERFLEKIKGLVP
jgi:putative NADPH-quinone reductase